MFTELSFAKRLALLLAIDAAIAEVDSYIPHNLWPVRMALAIAQLAFMAVTMGIAIRRVLEDF